MSIAYLRASAPKSTICSREDGAKAARRFGEPRVYVIGELLVIGMDGVIAQKRQIDPERIVVDNPVLECRAKAGSG